MASCPFFDFLPTEEQAGILDDEDVFQTMQDVNRRYAENGSVTGLSGRLLVVAQT
jgi:hypothetical protein